MTKKMLLGLMFIAYHLPTAVYGVNHKLLDLKAGMCASKIWSGTCISKSKIKENLTFMNEKDEEVEKYSKVEKFRNLNEKIERNIRNQKPPILEERNQRFLAFAKTCDEIFTEGDQTTKASIYMLLKFVTKKYSSDIRYAEILREREARAPKIDSDPEATAALVEIFFNADKSIVIPAGLKKRLEAIK